MPEPCITVGQLRQFLAEMASDCDGIAVWVSDDEGMASPAVELRHDLVASYSNGIEAGVEWVLFIAT